ncbi:hypothetical protein F4781DRAFT_432931 [Annulohypoxylon bovei var. microspora]|nr:hypothetical protein F4781DRAFT_432931 [Annulohypoxylon bovei var. microspora]
MEGMFVHPNTVLNACAAIERWLTGLENESGVLSSANETKIAEWLDSLWAWHNELRFAQSFERPPRDPNSVISRALRRNDEVESKLRRAQNTNEARKQERQEKERQERERRERERRERERRERERRERERRERERRERQARDRRR